MSYFAVTFLLLMLLTSCFESDNPRLEASQSASIRSVQTIHNLTQVWNKEEFYFPRVSPNMRFFMPSGPALVFPTINESQTSYALQAINITTGQTLWQTDIPYLGILRLYDGKLFNLHLSNKSLESAPVKDNKELPYCSFAQKSLLSAYDVHTGQELWSYEYRGVNEGELYFDNGIVYLGGTGDHGLSGLLAKVNINSGMIVDQQCARIREDKPVPKPPRNSQSGTAGYAYSVTSIGRSAYEYVCDGQSRFCFVTEGNRLNILTGNPKATVAYIDFSGDPLNDLESDVVVQNNIIAVHLDDSNQFFAFRLP